MEEEYDGKLNCREGEDWADDGVVSALSCLFIG